MATYIGKITNKGTQKTEAPLPQKKKSKQSVKSGTACGKRAK